MHGYRRQSALFFGLDQGSSAVIRRVTARAAGELLLAEKVEDLLRRRRTKCKRAINRSRAGLRRHKATSVFWPVLPILPIYQVL